MSESFVDLTPEFCPHCLAHFRNELVEIKTSAPPKCGRCLLPLWWEDRSGKEPDKAWPSYLELVQHRGQTRGTTTNLLPDKLIRMANTVMQFNGALNDMYPKDIVARVECAKALLELAHICANGPLRAVTFEDLKRRLWPSQPYLEPGQLP